MGKSFGLVTLILGQSGKIFKYSILVLFDFLKIATVDLSQFWHTVR